MRGPCPHCGKIIVAVATIQIVPEEETIKFTMPVQEPAAPPEEPDAQEPAAPPEPAPPPPPSREPVYEIAERMLVRPEGCNGAELAIALGWNSGASVRQVADTSGIKITRMEGTRYWGKRIKGWKPKLRSRRGSGQIGGGEKSRRIMDLGLSLGGVVHKEALAVSGWPTCSIPNVCAALILKRKEREGKGWRYWYRMPDDSEKN